MPYVDQGEPKPVTVPPIIPFVVVGIAMAAGVASFWFFYNQLNFNQWLAPLITGPLIGAALRFTAKGALPRTGTIAVVCSLLACLVGYVVRHVAWIKWVDPTFKPSVGHAFEWLFSADLMSILLIAMSAYLAYAIAGVVPYTVRQQPPNETTP